MFPDAAEPLTVRRVSAEATLARQTATTYARTAPFVLSVAASFISGPPLSSLLSWLTHVAHNARPASIRASSLRSLCKKPPGRRHLTYSKSRAGIPQYGLRLRVRCWQVDAASRHTADEMLLTESRRFPAKKGGSSENLTHALGDVREPYGRAHKGEHASLIPGHTPHTKYRVPARLGSDAARASRPRKLLTPTTCFARL